LQVLQEVLNDCEYDHPRLPEVQVILDLGSHTGASLLYFRAVYPDARIIGIEPNPDTFSRLRRNAESLNVEVYQFAVVSKDGPTDLYVGRNSLLSTTRRPEARARSVAVKGKTLFTLRQELGLDALDLIKIDIEAGEVDVLRSAGDARMIIGEFHSERDSAGLTDFVSLFDGFELSIHERPDSHPTFTAVRHVDSS